MCIHAKKRQKNNKKDPDLKKILSQFKSNEYHVYETKKHDKETHNHDGHKNRLKELLNIVTTDQKVMGNTKENHVDDSQGSNDDSFSSGSSFVNVD